MIGRLISDIGLEKTNLQTTKRIKHGEIPHGDLVKMAVMLLANGRTDFAGIDFYRDDPLFKEVPRIRKVASAALFISISQNSCLYVKLSLNKNNHHIQ